MILGQKFHCDNFSWKMDSIYIEILGAKDAQRNCGFVLKTIP